MLKEHRTIPTSAHKYLQHRIVHEEYFTPFLEKTKTNKLLIKFTTDIGPVSDLITF